MSWIILLLASLAGLAIAGDEVVRFSFDQPKEPTKGWTATPGAALAEYGRQGRSLYLSSYEEEKLIGKRPVGHNKAAWRSAAFAVPRDGADFLTVSAWGYAMFSYGQDASYAGVLGIEYLDPKGEPIRRAIAGRWIRDPSMALHERCRVLPWGIRWTYQEKAVPIPAAAQSAQLVFHFLKDPGGIVWVDDILVTKGKRSLTPATAASLKESPAKERPLPFDSWLRTPFYANLFLDDDPLHFDLMVWNPKDKTADVQLPPNPKLRFAVTDFDHLLVAEGEVTARSIAAEKFARHNATRIGFRLPSAIAKEIGRYLVCDVRLLAGDTVYACAATSFAVISPRKKTWHHDEVLAGHFGQGQSGLSMEGKLEEMSPRRRGVKGLINLFGARITYRYDFGGWKQHQPNPGPFIKMDALAKGTETRQAYNYGFYYHWSPERQHEWAPKWALQDPKQFPYRFRKADWLAYVKAVAETLKGRPIVYTPTGTERAPTPFMYECHRDAAKLIKKVDPDALVCLETVGLGEEGVRRAVELGVARDTDMYDMHMYSIRDFAPREFATLKGKLADLRGGKPVRVWSTELAYTGAFTQVSKAARLWDTHLKMFAAGFDAICWYTLQSAPVRDQKPVRREWPKFIGAWSHYNLLCGYGNGDVTPQLAAVAYANLIDALEDFRTVQRIPCDENTNVVAFHRDDISVIGLWRQPMRGRTELWLAGLGDAKGTAMDIFGRRHAITGERGRMLLTVTENPLLLILDRKASGVSCELAGQVLSDEPSSRHEVARGSRWRISVVPESGLVSEPVRISAQVGSGFECSAERKGKGKGKGKETAISVNAPSREKFPGESFPVWISCQNASGQRFGLLRRRVWLVQSVRIRMDSEYASPGKGNLLLRIRNTEDRPLSPRISVQIDNLSSTLRPARPNRVFPLAAGQEAEWPISLDLPAHWWHDFQAKATWTTRDAAGVYERTVHFRPSLRASGAMKMDGGLSDWQDAAWVPAIHMSYMMGGNLNVRWRPWDEEWTAPDDARMFLASKWDQSRLYFAARIIDDHFLVEADTTEKLRYGDSIHFCYYAGGIEPGDHPRLRVYKDWIAGLTSGAGGLVRKAGPFGPSRCVLPGVEIGFRRTKEGGVLEWSYPVSCVRPLALRAGQEFRVCACYQDFDEPLPWVEKMLDPFMSGPHGGYGTKMRYIHVGQRFIGINHDPLLFAPFKMVGGDRK